MREYILRYHHCAPEELPRLKKFPFVYLLKNTYGFECLDIAVFFGCSKASAYRLISDANYFHEKHPRQRAEEDRIANYILYIAQWRNYKSKA